MVELNRRQVVLPLLVAGLGGPALAAPAGGADLRALGAKGDGVTDDTAALARALAGGRPLDGGGRTYGVSGSLQLGPSFRGLSNCVLKQLLPSDRNRTLMVDGASGFRIANVTVVRGGRDDNAYVQRDMFENAGVWIHGCSGFEIERLTVRGGGVGTGLIVDDCRQFTAVDARVHAIRYRRRTRPDDDIIQGMWIGRSRNFELVRPKVFDLGGQDSQGFSRNNNRAIALGGCSRFNIRDVSVSQCGQGLDLTGSDGNADFQVIGGRAQDCWTWGFKFANSAQRGKVIGGQATRCGLGGFVVSGPSEDGNPLPYGIEIADCFAHDCGRPDSRDTMFGFGILYGRFHKTWPRRISFVRCTAIDSRARRGMKWGFFTEVEAPPAEANRVQDCRVRGALLADYFGFKR